MDSAEQQALIQKQQVRDKSVAPVQICAEQILQEAQKRSQNKAKQPVYDIQDKEELRDYQFRQRRVFENAVRINRSNFKAWLKYAEFEEKQFQLERCRSVFERMLSIDDRNQLIWTRYIEMEQRTENINHARNIFERVVKLLPRVDQFWYKYALMEESLGQRAMALKVYQRWMTWQPKKEAYLLFIGFLQRSKQPADVIRLTFRDWCRSHCDAQSFTRWAQWEESQGQLQNARAVFSLAIDILFQGEELYKHAQLVVSFARFEVRHKELERARSLYKYAQLQLEQLDVGNFDEQAQIHFKTESDKVYFSYAQFEKQFGDQSNIENVIIEKRRHHYEQLVKDIPTNYDAWFDYLKLEEGGLLASVDSGDQLEKQRSGRKCRELYQRAVVNVPPINEKQYWRRYIFLWIKYALFEECSMQDIDRTRKVYTQMLKVVPHKQFTFAKIWLLAAKFEIRQKKLMDARKLLGRALGMCAKPKLFAGYIELEMELCEFERCRMLYEKFIMFDPASVKTWVKYAELEAILGEIDRCRGIFEIAVEQTSLDLPGILWKAYIDFEIEQNEVKKASELYMRQIRRFNSSENWTQFAEFKYSFSDGQDPHLAARNVYEQGFEKLKNLNEDRRLILLAWLKFEEASVNDGDDDQFFQQLKLRLPTKVKRMRQVKNYSGQIYMEEYVDYVFRETSDEQKTSQDQSSLSQLLAKARDWKNQGKDKQE